MNIFKKYSEYYDLFYEDKNYLEETKYINSLIKINLPKAKTILDLGCGTGKHDLALSKLGYKVIGVDRSSEMINIAKQKIDNKNVEFIKGDIKDIRLDKKFNVIISMFHVLSYQISNNDLKCFFNTVNNHLEKDGILIFDCWYGPSVLTNLPQVKIRKISDKKRTIIRNTFPKILENENIVEINYQILVIDNIVKKVEEINETHKMRYLFKPELQNYLNDINMQILSSAEFLTNRELSINTWGACFICNKVI